MTRILKLEAKGFKSFANKTELLFSENFNCVIGPNGSGKSNILDSLCFVLGRTSVKSLRAENSKSLIYNGGKTKQPAKEGMVEITFDNEDSTFPLDTPTVTITRLVKNNGTGVYKINGEKTTRQAIKELLTNARLDPDGHNIILQGDIIHMIDMSPNERRGVVEDVAGIGVYEERKQKTLRELEKVDQKLNDTQIILNERENNIKELKVERDQAIKYKEVIDKINTNKAMQVRAQVRARKAKIDDAEEHINNSSNKIKDLKEQVVKHSKIITKSKSDIEEINTQIEAEGEEKQVNLQKEIEQMKVDFATNKTKIDNLDNELTRIKTRRDELKAESDVIKEKSSDFDRNRKMLVTSQEASNTSLQQIEEKIAKFKEKNNMGDSAKIDEEIDAIDKELEENTKVIEQKRQEQQEMFREKDKLEYQNENLEEQAFKLTEATKESEEQLKDLKNKKVQFQKLTTDLNKLISDDASLSAQMSTAKGKLQSSQDELNKLEAQRQKAQAKIAGNIATKEILEVKKKGTIRGIIGSVSELGNVKKEYAVALEVAAGNRIKGIVVEDDKVGAQCLRFLKDNRIGSSSFLPLNKIRAPRTPDGINSFLNQDGVYGLCTDLFQASDSRYKKVFEYVFGPTIVVRNVEVARRIGVGKVRMVTLDGDLIEPSGAMVGGYKKASLSGAFADGDVVKKIEELELEVGNQSSLIDALRRRKEELEESVTRQRNFKAELEGEILKLSKALKVDEVDTKEIEETKKKNLERIEEIDKLLREMGNNLGMLNKEAVQKKIKKQQLKAKVNDLRNPLKIAELNTLEAQRQKTREELIRIESEIKTLDIQIKDIIGPEGEKIAKILKQLDTEEEKFAFDKKTLTETNVKLDVDIKEKELIQKEFYAKFKELFDKKSKAQNELKTSETKITKLEADIKILENKINLATLNLTQFKAELSGFEKEFEQYKDLTLPDSEKSEAQIKSEIDRYQRQVEEMGNVNMKALEIYEKVEEEYKNLKEKYEKLIVEKEDILIMINEIETNKKEIFMKTFNEVNDVFKRIFLTLSSKGDAYLELENEESPFDGGLTMKVRLNAKKFMDIRSLSGGEKTMTALALLFAIQEYEPAPFYILDEVDAALDKRNAERVAELVNQYTDRAQYIVISHNDGVISAADSLFGISMDEHGITKITTLKV